MGVRINTNTYPNIKIVEVSSSLFIQLLSCNEKASRKKILQIKATLDKNKSPRISEFRKC